MTSPSAVALVAAVTGEGIVRDETGAWRALRAGDVLYEDDMVMSGHNGRVEIITADSRSLSVWPNETLKIDDEVVGPFLPDANAAAIRSIDGNFPAIPLMPGMSSDALPVSTSDAAQTVGAGAAFAHLLHLTESLVAEVNPQAMAPLPGLLHSTGEANAHLDLRDLLPGGEAAHLGAGKQFDGSADPPAVDKNGGVDEHVLTSLDTAMVNQNQGHGMEYAAIVQALADHHKPVID